jgi:energy-coupling factor transport system permease protein
MTTTPQTEDETTADATGAGGTMAAATTLDAATTGGGRTRSRWGRRRRPRSFVLLREIEADTVVHRLWAGTKLVAAVVLSLTISFFPVWPMVAASAAVLLVSTMLARVPWSAIPRPPGWFWAALVIGAALTLISGGKPEVRILGGHLGVGNVESYVLFVAIGVVLIWAGVLIGWTTSLGDVGPAVGRLLGPLRRFRVPADEWAIAIALCMRCLPLIVDEMRTLIAARRLRPSPPVSRNLLRYVDEAGQLLVAGLSVSLRRAAEMAEAMTARGGTASITQRAPGPKRRDAIALAIVVAVCVAGVLAPR